MNATCAWSVACCLAVRIMRAVRENIGQHRAVARSKTEVEPSKEYHGLRKNGKQKTEEQRAVDKKTQRTILEKTYNICFLSL